MNRENVLPRPQRAEMGREIELIRSARSGTLKLDAQIIDIHRLVAVPGTRDQLHASLVWLEPGNQNIAHHCDHLFRRPVGIRGQRD